MVLSISVEQEKHLARANRLEFLFETIDLLNKAAPDHLKGLTDAQAQRKIAGSIQQAEAYGFTSGLDIRRYVAMEAVAGFGFESMPEYSAIATAFSDTTKPPSERLDIAANLLTKSGKSGSRAA